MFPCQEQMRNSPEESPPLLNRGSRRAHRRRLRALQARRRGGELRAGDAPDSYLMNRPDIASARRTPLVIEVSTVPTPSRMKPR